MNAFAGFEFEDFVWIKDAIHHIDEDEIIFVDVNALTSEQQERIQKII